MSILGKFIRIWDLCFIKPNPKVFEPVVAGIVGVGCLMHATYAYTTQATEEITVESKYQIFNPVGTAFGVHTTDGRQFMIPSSVWYWQFDVPEQWNNMQPGKKYKVSTYGYRIPYLAMFPNIVKIEKS